MRDRAEPEPRWRVRERGAGDLATVAEIDVELALALGVGRRRDCVPFVGESAGVKRREANCARWVRDEPDARSVVVDAGSELTDPLGYNNGRYSKRAEGIMLPEGAGGGGVRERSSPPGRGVSRRGAGEPWAEKARRLLSLVTVRGCPSESAIPGVFMSGRERGPEGLESGADVDTVDGGGEVQIPWDQIAISGHCIPSTGLRSPRGTVWCLDECFIQWHHFDLTTTLSTSMYSTVT